MYRFKNILVHASLRGDDVNLIRYAAKITHMAHSARVCFLHADMPPDIPAEVSEKYPWLAEPITQASERRLSELVAEHYDGHPETVVSIEAVQDSPVYSILKKSQEIDADLIIMNRITDDSSMAKKVARKSSCSLMLVPEGADPEFKHVIVPTDFSKYSRDALEIALAFADAQKISTVSIYHAFQLPFGFKRTHISKEDFESDLTKHFRQQADIFLSEIDLRGIQINTLVECKPLVPQAIAMATDENHADLLMVGSRGHNALASLLLGNTAEAILEQTKRPIVIVKRKGTGQSLLQSLLEGKY